MSLRQLWVRIKALPQDAPLWLEVARDQAEAEAKAEADSLDETLAMMRRQ